MIRRIASLFAIALFLPSTLAVGADEVRNRTDYQIALSGLPLANASFQTRKDGRTYNVDAQIASTGIGDILLDAKAEMSSSGSVDGGAFEPGKFSFHYKYGRKSRKFETEFRNGNVVSSVVEPKPKKRKGWVEVKPEDLRQVTDPIAALVVPDRLDPCRSEIKVYDGESRLSLRLARKREDTFRTDGFKGQAVVCSLAYEPKSGYRKGHKDVEYIRRLRSMEIWFAKAAAMNLYAPVYLSVPTKYGTLTITATHFDG